MTTQTNAQAARHERERMNPNVMGMLVFLGSEAVFFAFLITAYLYFGAGQNSGDAGPNKLEPVTTLIFSLFLFSSSGTIYLADRAMARNNMRGFTIWLIATIVLGLIFIAGQGMEYIKLFSDNITMSRNQFATTFFTMTGFHGMHVIAGLIMMSIIAGMTIAGKIKGRSGAAEAISLYWHFVDIVWVVIFSIVYLGLLFK